MKIYDVLLSKILSAKVQIKAENAQEAEEIALDQFLHCEIELEENGIPEDVNISASEAGVQTLSSSGVISIYWNDLIPAKRAEILAAFGENCNYDVFPIVEIPISEEDSK